LKKILKKRKELRVVVSSATVDAEQFCRFFNNTNSLNTKGLNTTAKSIKKEVNLTTTNTKNEIKTEPDIPKNLDNNETCVIFSIPGRSYPGF
jgi:hypothetical protein